MTHAIKHLTDDDHLQQWLDDQDTKAREEQATRKRQAKTHPRLTWEQIRLNWRVQVLAKTINNNHHRG